VKYRKRPVVIDAIRWTGQNADEVKAFVGQRPGSGGDGFQLPGGATKEWDQAHVWAEAEGCWMRCPVGHWVIRGVAGEFYPHDPSTFNITYETIDDEAEDAAPGNLAQPGLRGPLVGASAVIVRGDRVLLGRRRGAHGAGTFAFPGGKPRPGESPADGVVREVLEETGLVLESVAPIMWTDEIFGGRGLHFVTLHYQARVPGSAEPAVLEPEKCESWGWYRWSALPRPLFAAAAHLVESGWRPGPEATAARPAVSAVGTRRRLS
jgi:8-oxo-dGTP diphosphatase